MAADQAAGALSTPAPTGAPTMRIWGPLVLLWVVWGSTYLGIAVVVAVLPPLVSTGLRLLGGALILAIGLAIVKGPGVFRVSREQLRSAALLGLGMPGIGLGALSLAERYVPSGVAALVVAAIPLWVVLLRMGTGDRPTRTTILGVAIGLLGLGYLLLPGGTVPRAGTEGDVVLWTAVLLFSSLVWAFSSWRSGSMDLPRDSLVGATYELGFGGIFLVVVGTIVGERLEFSGMYPMAWVAWIALTIASAVGFATFTWLIARAPLSLVATYAYVNPLIAVMLGAVLLSEAITRDVIWGLVVVIGSVVLVVRGERTAS